MYRDVMNAERARTGNYGNDYYEDEEVVRCEICGRETDTVYLDKDGDIVGCENCIQRRYVDEIPAGTRWA